MAKMYSGPMTRRRAAMLALERTAAQRALAIPEILENIFQRAIVRFEPSSMRRIRLVNRLWAQAAGRLALSRTCLDGSRFRDSWTYQTLDGIIASQGSIECVRGIRFDDQQGKLQDAFSQLLLCSGLARLSIHLIHLSDLAATSCGLRHKASAIFPLLHTLVMHIPAGAGRVLSSDLAFLKKAIGTAIIAAEVAVAYLRQPASFTALLSIAGALPQRLSILNISDSGDKLGETVISRTLDALEQLVPILPRLQHLYIPAPVATRTAQLLAPPLQPILQQVVVDCWHSSVATVMLDIAMHATSPETLVNQLRFHCNDPGRRKAAQEVASGQDAIRKAASTWEKARKIVIPEPVIRSWLACECRSW